MLGKKERTEMNKIINGWGDISTDAREIQRILRDYYEQYANKLDNLEKLLKY